VSDEVLEPTSGQAPRGAVGRSPGAPRDDGVEGEPAALARPRLEGRALVVQKGGSVLVRGASIVIHGGEVAVIEGASGSGKTSLLRALATLDPLEGGAVLLGGIDAGSMPPEVFRRRVAYVAQQPVMLEGSAADNVARGPGLRGEALTTEQICALLERVGLGSLDPGREARGLSGGERQRLALARALANEPEFLLLDEPTSALDPASAGHVVALLAGLGRGAADRAIGVVVVTHVREHALMLGGRLQRCEGGVLSAGEGDAPREGAR
jgi:putative ABC transport system ATP-binding protein